MPNRAPLGEAKIAMATAVPSLFTVNASSRSASARYASKAAKTPLAQRVR